MAFEIIIKPIVFLDLDEAINWYESEQEGWQPGFINLLKLQLKESKKILRHLLMSLRGVKEYF
ncbi:MAG: hypothetical protein ACTHM5_18875 [Ginsengibacter sp.]